MDYWSEEKPDETKPKIKPFHVHFGKKNLAGRSNIRAGYPLGVPHTVTEKFYKRNVNNISEEEIQKQFEKLKIYKPMEKFKDPRTENQRYGWYYNVKLTNLDKSDRRINFSMNTDHFIKLYLHTMEKKNTK